MNETPLPGEFWIKAFRKALDDAFGRDNYPPVSGDLSDLRLTLEDTVKAADIVTKTPPGPDFAKRVHHLQIMIENDLPMIFEDLLPPLRELVNRAYELFPDDDEEEDEEEEG